MRAVVFLGPTLPVASAREVLPDAIFLPPAGQADLITAVRRHRPDVVALIDGVFLQSLSVWHKEILWALARGVAVHGASSMGALRAAECAEFGMVGVGAVYEAYASGAINDDDEVALAHADAEAGYRAASVPLVNLRATLRAAVGAGRLTSGEEALVIAATRGLYFPDRSLARILTAAGAAGLGPERVAALREVLREHFVDQKREDALELLRRLRDEPVEPPQAPADVSRSHVFDALLERDVRVERDGSEVALEDVHIHVGLNHPGFHAVREAALARLLVLNQAASLGVAVGPEEVEEETRRFLLARALNSDERVRAWLADNDLEPEEFGRLMREEALLRRMQDWARTQQFKRGSVRPVLDWLRLTGEYPEWVRRAAETERVLAAEGPFPEPPPTELGALLREHVSATGWRPDGRLDVLAEELGLHGGVHEVEFELRRQARARERMRWLVGLTDDPPAPER